MIDWRPHLHRGKTRTFHLANFFSRSTTPWEGESLVTGLAIRSSSLSEIAPPLNYLSDHPLLPAVLPVKPSHACGRRLLPDGFQLDDSGKTYRNGERRRG